MRKYIPYGHQYIDDDDINAVVEVLKSDYLTTGPKIAEFEKKFAEYVGVKYAVAVANGTAALHVAMLAAGVGEGDEVITTPITFAASANCALYCGATPVFADINPHTYNIDVNDIEKKITSRTKVVVPVHFTGQPCDMDAIMEVAEKHNLMVIADGSHALGAKYKGNSVFQYGDMVTCSFHPIKHITTGEGGIIVTDNEDLYKKLILFRTHGITRNEELLEENHGPWYYEQLELGYNYRMNDFQAALGISQLDKADMFVKRRREIAKKYDEAFRDVPGITVPYQAEFGESGYHLYVIQVASHRKEIFEALRAEGIGVNVNYIPIYTFPYYRRNGYGDVYLANAQEYYEHTISIPMYYGLTDEEQDYVIEKIIEENNRYYHEV